jgi:RNA-binding protein
MGTFSWAFAYTAAMIPLASKKRSELRAEAHKLTPIVIIGDKGLTDEVVAEIDRSLKAHELIKVRAATDEREARDAWLETICERLAAHAVQQIGKVFVIYRENPKEEKPKRKLGPGPSPRSGVRGDEARKPRSGARGDEARKPRSGARGEERPKGTSRPRSRTPSPRPASEPRRRRPRTSR